MARMSWDGAILYCSNGGSSYNFRDSQPNWPLAKNANRPYMTVSIAHGVDGSKTPGERNLDGFE